MAYACDIQMLMGPDGRYIIKEFALFETNLQRDEFKVASIAPPCLELALPPSVVTHNHYVTQKIHGLTWDSGLSPYESMEDTLRQFTEFVTDLYIKREEKRKLLQDLLPHLNVINIEKLGCPAFKKLPKLWAPCNSEIHAVNPQVTCAAKNAKRIGLWLLFCWARR